MPMRNVLAMVLGGGRGSRLYPLTKQRTKPAVPLAGGYRLIDIPLSNCVNSGVERIFVLTQYLSGSLVRHVQRTYRFGMFSRGFVDLLPAEQKLKSSDWYQGTADAVRQSFQYFERWSGSEALILAGDHLYRMDYRRFVEAHRRSGAGLTVAVRPIPAADAPRFGVLQATADGEITRFVEKPPADRVEGLVSPTGDPERPFLGSMGIYVFDMGLLKRLLAEVDGTDFGSDVIPAAVRDPGISVQAWPFEDYWADIGTLRSFYDANLALARSEAGGTRRTAFELYDPLRPIYTRPRFLPPSAIDGCRLRRAIVGAGCRLSQADIEESVVGLRSVLGAGARLRRVVMLGADFYEGGEALGAGTPPLGIGADSIIERAIIDKNARIGREVIIRSAKGRPDSEHENWVVRDGFVVVPKNAVIPDGTII